MSPKAHSIILNAIVLVAASGTLAIAANISHLLAWLVVANLQLTALMAKDKLASTQNWRRTPEITLLLLALLGATPAMFIARHIFKHKSSKASFKTELYGVLILQLILAYVWRNQLLAGF